jgi:hypothetical protein
VLVQVSDPIGAGFITNLARPGGHVAGETEKWGKVIKFAGIKAD